LLICKARRINRWGTKAMDTEPTNIGRDSWLDGYTQLLISPLKASDEIIELDDDGLDSSITGRIVHGRR
jgi:hypothetical protein